MKNILALSFVLGSTLFSTVCLANTERKSNISYSMPAVEVGFKWSSASLTNADSTNQVIGFEVGGSAVFNIGDNFGIKTGLFYNERPFQSVIAGTTVTGKLTYFDVPVLLMFKFEDYAGIYLGPSLSLKLSDQLSPGNLTKINSVVVPLTFGAQFKFAPNLGADIYFETVPGNMSNEVSNSRAVGLNLMIAFD